MNLTLPEPYDYGTLHDCETSRWALYDCDTPWGIFMSVAFFLYHQLNLIDDSLTDLTELG